MRVTNLKNLPNFNLWIFKQMLHATHLLKLLNKMCKYEMDPMSLLKIQSWHDSVHRWTDGQTDKVKPVYTFQHFWSKVRGGGIKIFCNMYRKTFKMYKMVASLIKLKLEISVKACFLFGQPRWYAWLFWHIPSIIWYVQILAQSIW